MKNEREDKLNVQLSASDGIPKVSFTTSDENDQRLKGEEYHIAGNDFTAYYNAAHKLIFVVDRTLDERKPNVLLVINPVGDRKWDDILANDYDVDLETVRPKVDNKYQKLDIDYKGLSVYNNLINEYNAGQDLDDALVQMSNFRDESVRRSAMERLTAAEESMDKTRDTIAKTNETIREMQDKVQTLRKKLTRQKKEVGKEPTKQSAAKILKTESQIDAANDKIKRSKKRLQNAQRRMLVAENDAEIARKILEQRPLEIQTTTVKAEPSKDVIMAEEEVKPLFEKDPEILDENIAFKPIDFSTPSKPVTETVTVKQTAPVMTENADPVLDTLHSTQSEIIEPIPLESVFSTSTGFTPVPDVPSEPLTFTPPIMNEEIREQESFAAPKPTFTPEPIITPDEIVVTAPVVEPEPTIFEETPVVNQVEPLQQSNPIPVAEPIAEEIRPVSPITGTSGATISGGATRAKPSPLYYIMLIVLIVLSVMTLWLYQKNSGDTVPELITTDVVEQRVVPTPAPAPVPPVVDSPFIQVESVVEEPAPVPVVQPEPEVLQPVVEETPVFVEPEPTVFIEQPVPVEEPVTIEETDSYYDPEPVYNVVEEPVTIEQPAQPVAVTEPVVNKPAYGVSSDRTFVADENYETDRLPDGTYYDDVYYDDEEYYY